MHIIATHINYYQVCHRKLWLFANGIQMEHNSELVAEGKLIGETTYPGRAEKYAEIEIDGVKIDFYDARNKVVHEVKKSDKIEQAHIWQVKYYLYKLAQHGVPDATGMIEYPKLRQRETVELNDGDTLLIQQWEKKISELIHSETCPDVIRKPVCKNCSYNDFCYVNEPE